MAGTMMKTRRRVKRTVREMPSKLTIRLLKGSSRNMVVDPDKAKAFHPNRNPVGPETFKLSSLGVTVCERN